MHTPLHAPSPALTQATSLDDVLQLLMQAGLVGGGAPCSGHTSRGSRRTMVTTRLVFPFTCLRHSVSLTLSGPTPSVSFTTRQPPRILIPKTDSMDRLFVSPFVWSAAGSQVGASGSSLDEEAVEEWQLAVDTTAERAVGRCMTWRVQLQQAAVQGGWRSDAFCPPRCAAAVAKADPCTHACMRACVQAKRVCTTAAPLGLLQSCVPQGTGDMKL
jgi:hypothetical protein